MSSSPSSIPSSSFRPPRDLEDTLIFGEDPQSVKNWYTRQSRDGSTTIKTIQLRNEYAFPFHQFIVVQTQGELGCAYRVDRGREREGWTVLDTISKLGGVPPRDTIALLEEPVGELDKTSQCTKELLCSDDKTIDLSFVLGICFRIHNNWGRRYDLLAFNCYFFARTIINICDDRLGKKSSRSKYTLKHILGKLIRWLPLLSCVLLLVLVLALRLAYVGGFHWDLGVGIALGVVNLLIMLLAMMQVCVAVAVRVVVAQVVRREWELEQGEILEVEWLDKLFGLMPSTAAWGLLMLEFVGLFLMNALPLNHPFHGKLLIGFAYSLSVGVALPILLAVLFSFRRVPNVRRGHLSNTRAEDTSGVVRAAAEPEQELGVELAATGRPARQGNVGAAVTTDQAAATKVEGDSDGRCGAVGTGAGIRGTGLARWDDHDCRANVA